MKKPLQSVITWVFVSLFIGHAAAQYPVLCTVYQANILQADAGSSQSVVAGTVIQLGATTVATGGSPPYHYRWSPAFGLNDSTLPNPTLTADSTLTYTLEVYDTDGCIASSSVHISLLIGISEGERAKESYAVFPNPSSTGVLHVQTTKVITDPIEITVQRISGEVVFSTRFIPNCVVTPIDLSWLSAGVYMMRITGAEVYHQKIILQ
jgi:hypothetical protein